MIKIKLLSLNEKFLGKQIKTNKCKQFEQQVSLHLLNRKLQLDEGKYYKISYSFYVSNAGSDVDNCIKVIQDQIELRAQSYDCKFNDNQFWKIEATKYLVAKGDEGFYFDIEEIDLPIDNSIENKKHKFSKKKRQPLCGCQKCLINRMKK